MKYLATFILMLTLSFQSFAQPDMKQFEGDWEGTFDSSAVFALPVKLTQVNDTRIVAIYIGKDSVLIPIEKQNDHWSGSKDGIAIQGFFTKSEKQFRCFITSGVLQYHVILFKQKKGRHEGRWRPLMIESLMNDRLYLSVENVQRQQFEAYPIFGDQRFSGTWCGGFQQKGKLIYFSDFKTGLSFRGILGDQRIDLVLMIAGKTLTQVALQPSTEAWQLGVLAEPQIRSTMDHPLTKSLEDSILAQALPNTHGISVSQKGKPVYEAYFDGHSANVPHDQRSASKPIASMLLGVTIQQGVITSETTLLKDLLPAQYQEFFADDERKSAINLQHLLTMSSGLDAIDFGIDRNSQASEGSYQNSSDWARTVLGADMIQAPGSKAYYGSANPYLIGLALAEQIDSPLSLFMDRTLFEPLGIDNYVIQNDRSGTPYFGGGMYFTTRDMNTIGTAALHSASGSKSALLDAAWMKKSWTDYRPLENANDRNGYGYLWWHHDYEVEGRSYHSIEARGSGGQYIIVIPDLDVVIAITSGNFRNGKFAQPERITEQYLLPMLTSKAKK